MTLDGRLVGIDDYEYDDYYVPLIDAMKAALVQNGINEPLVFGEAGQEIKGEIGSSGGFQQLRSYAAYIAVHSAAPDEPDMSVIGHELNEMYQHRIPYGKFAHLINHSDSSGYYIPIDFAEPFTFDAPAFDGGTRKVDVGSSVALLRELDAMNEFLKVPGDCGQLNGTARLAQLTESDIFESEKRGWGMMRWLARESVERRLLFEFC